MVAALMSHPHQVSTIKGFNPDDTFSLEGIDDGTFAIASSKKELKQLMKSDADVVYDERKGKLFLNDNGTAKGWGAKQVGGLVAKFKGKPELSADLFNELTAHGGDDITGGADIKDQIATFREGLSDADESKLYGETQITPRKELSASERQPRERDICSIRMNLPTLSMKWIKPVHLSVWKWMMHL